MKKNLKDSKYFVCFVSLLAFFFVGGFATEVSAKELVQTGIVDSFELPQRTKRNVTTDIKVKFSSKNDYEVKSGDTLTLTLPTRLTGTLAKDIPVLGSDNVQYGVMNVVQGQAVVTFNDSVNNYKLISGELMIPVYGEIKSDIEGTLVQLPNGREIKELKLTSNLGTNLPDKNYEVWEYIIKPGPGTAYMYKKAGGIKKDYSYDVAEYQIQVKAREYDVEKDITLIDKLDQYQYFPDESELLSPNKIDFMEINYISQTESKSMTIKEFVENGYGTYELINNREFHMTFNKDKANGYLVDIYYRVKLTEEAKTIKPEFVVNKSTETYDRVDMEEKTENKDATIPVSYPDASARPIKGTLWIIKKKQYDEQSWEKQEFLPGVTFNVYHSDGTLVKGGENLVTDKDGKIVLPDLTTGKYYAREMKAPSDVNFDTNKKYEFEITDAAKYGVVLAISNPANAPKAEFTADKKADKKLLKPGDTFTYTISVKNTVPGSTLKNVVVEDTMPEGIEFVGDLKLNGAPIGTANGNSIKVTIPEIKGNDTAQITFTAKASDTAKEGEVTNIATVTDPNDPDKPKKPEEKVEIFREVDLRLIKTDMEGKTVLKDALFELYQVVDGKEKLLTSLSSDMNGRINFEKLKSGTYIIKEKAAPNGYQLLDKPIQLTIDKLGELKLSGELSEMVSLIKKDKTFELTVKNKAEEVPGGQLPQTGGSGHLGTIITASIFMLFALGLAGYYVYRSRKGWKS